MGEKALTPRKRRESYLTSHRIPDSHSQVDRYRRVQAQIERLGLESLHGIARQTLDEMLTRMEAYVAKAEAETT